MKVVVVDSVRTGISKAIKGKLRDTPPAQMAAHCIDALLQRHPQVLTQHVDGCVIGCAFPEGAQGMNIARSAVGLSGLDLHTPGLTVSRYCASGLDAIATAAAQIECGNAECMVAGGVESASLVLPHVNTHCLYNDKLKRKHPGFYLGMDTCDARMPFRRNALHSMGLTAEVVAEQYSIGRCEQDEYALLSHDRTQRAREHGFFAQDIIPIQTWHGLVSEDECGHSPVSFNSLQACKPAFKPDGSVTAGNSAPLTDGASMCLLMSPRLARQLGIAYLGYFRGHVATGCAPQEMGVGPVAAIQALLGKLDLRIGDIDLFEINEAFSATLLLCQRQLGIAMDRVNVNGGALSLGHPFGMTGSRQVGQVLRELARRNRPLGVVSLCVGGGMGVASLLERAQS